MADEEGYSIMDDMDYDWLYVEDDYPLSDELAETQIPDPGYAGTAAEIYEDQDELDIFSYWDETEYIDDEYWDNAQLGALASNPTAKRKRDEHVTESHGVKRRRMIMGSIENVKFVSWAKRLERFKEPPPSLEKVKPVALLPDWRERFANNTGVIVEKAMPEAMKKAAEAQEEDTPPKKRQFDALVEEGNDEQWMDEDEVEDEDEAGGDMAAQLASLDPEMLKAVLEPKLAGLGLAERSAIMSAIEKMVSGQEGADEAAAELTDFLVRQATQQKDSAVSGWLGEQGVSGSLVEAEDDDASSVATNELPQSSSRASTSNVEVSPPDSAVEMLKQKAETRQMAIHGSSPSASGKKRAAPPDSEDEGPSKRKRVTFDMPASSQPTESATIENGEAEPHNDVGCEIENEVEPITSEDPLMSEPTIHTTTTTTQSKAESAKSANNKALKTNGSIPGRSTGAKNYAKPTAAASAKQTRKRKAEADEDDVEAGAPKQKRPVRKAAKSEPEVPVVEPAGRRTRSARAKAGK